MISTYSFTADEAGEAEAHGLALSPSKSDDALFDEAIAEIYHRQQELRRQDQDAMLG